MLKRCDLESSNQSFSALKSAPGHRDICGQHHRSSPRFKAMERLISIPLLLRVTTQEATGALTHDVPHQNADVHEVMLAEL